MLSDIRMPEISGIKLARKVKEINPNVKVILMTSFEIKDNEFSKVFPSTQVDGFVQKPIDIKDLTNKILEHHRRKLRRDYIRYEDDRRAEASDIESVMQWFENGIEEGENGILVYPNCKHSGRYTCSMLKTN